MSYDPELPQSWCICNGFGPANEATASKTTALFKAGSWVSVFIRRAFIGQITERRVFRSANPVPSVSSVHFLNKMTLCCFLLPLELFLKALRV